MKKIKKMKKITRKKKKFKIKIIMMICKRSLQQ